jgi:leucyl aminopeptidase (aminopeptidase T)
MNERIKQLWEEAAKTTQGDSWEEQTKFMERFAELIVRKCISEVAMMGVVHYDNPDIAWAVNTIIGNLKENFEIK